MHTRPHPIPETRRASAARPHTSKVYFEVTNCCNFRCDFCPIQVSVRPPHHMDYALLQKGIEEVARDAIAPCIGFHVLGEPLLYGQIFDAIAYAKRRSLGTELNTNGSLLTRDRIERLIDAGLDTLTISLQTDQTEHDCRESGLPFRRYYDRILDAVRVIHASSQLNVVVCTMNTSTRWWFDIDAGMRLSLRQADYRHKVRCLAADLSDAVGVAPPPATAIAALRPSRPQILELTDRVAVYAQPLADWGNAFTSRHVHPAQFGACGYALENVGVLSNGDVTVCCADYDGHTTLGNLRTEALATLLESTQARAIRRGFDHLRPVHPHCRRCLGSTSRLRTLAKGLASIYLFRWEGFQPARVRRVDLNAPRRGRARSTTPFESGGCGD